MNPDPSEDVLLERRELDARGRLAAKLVFAGVLTDEDDASLEDEDLDTDRKMDKSDMNFNLGSEKQL